MILTEDKPKYAHRPFQHGDFLKVVAADRAKNLGITNETREKHVGMIGQVNSLFDPAGTTCDLLFDDGYYVAYDESELEATGLPKGYLQNTLTIVDPGLWKDTAFFDPTNFKIRTILLEKP